MKPTKRRLGWVWGLAVLLIVGIVVLFSVEESRTFIFALGLRAIFFAKKHIIILLTGFFLVKGKFILTLFLKKIALLSATGLGKRYFIEKVITHHFKIHFLDYLKDDIKHLMTYIKKNFKNFPLIKQIIAGFVFLGSLGFVGKFMGGMLAMKVFIAKVWSFLLALSLKVGTGIFYFFTDYIWGSWLAPIVEVVIFTWLLELMEKVPLFKRGLLKIYASFTLLFGWLEQYMEKVLHVPVKRFIKYLRMRVKATIYRFTGMKRVSARKRLENRRECYPNTHSRVLKDRKAKKAERSTSASVWKRLQKRRKTFKERKPQKE